MANKRLTLFKKQKQYSQENQVDANMSVITLNEYINNTQE